MAVATTLAITAAVGGITSMVGAQVKKNEAKKQMEAEAKKTHVHDYLKHVPMLMPYQYDIVIQLLHRKAIFQSILYYLDFGRLFAF